MRPEVTAIVPLRRPGVGKTRLSSALGPDERAELTIAMFGDVVAALQASSVDHLLVAADGPAAGAVAAGVDVRVVLDPPDVHDLDDALAAATRGVPASHDVVVVPADLPRLTAADIDALLAADGQVVVAPTTAGGTGGLLRRAGARIPTAFGPGSAARHRRRAADAGLTVSTVGRDGFHHDIDTWTDLAALHAVEFGPRTARVLPRLLGGRSRVG